MSDVPRRACLLSFQLILATLDGSRPKRYAVWMPKMAKVKNLRQRLAKATGKREDRLAFTLVWLHKIHDVFEVSPLVWPLVTGVVTDDRGLSRVLVDFNCMFGSSVKAATSVFLWTNKYEYCAQSSYA